MNGCEAATLDDVVAILRTMATAMAQGTSILISREAFAGLLDVGLSTFDRLRETGGIGPQPVRLGGALRWHRD